MSNTFSILETGVVGVKPSWAFLTTADDLATITTAGYMNTTLQNSGLALAPNDYVLCSYSSGAENAIFYVAYPNGGLITLIAVAGSETSNINANNLPGGAGWFTSIVDNVLQFKSLVNGPNLQLINTADTLGLGQLSALLYADITATHTALAGSGKVNLIVHSSATATYAIRELQINLVGTNFSGVSGDRDLSITDGTSVYSVIPAATLQALANDRWGGTNIPFPASVSVSLHTVAGSNLYAQYSGGTTDYTAGSAVVTIGYQQLVA